MLKIRIATIIVLSAIILSACGGVTPYPTPSTPSVTFIPSTTTPIPTATSLPSATITPWYTPTPETLNGYPTPEAVITFPPCAPLDFSVVQMRIFIGKIFQFTNYMLENMSYETGVI